MPLQYRTTESPISGQVVDESGNVLTVKRAVVDHATSGNNTIVAAVSGKKIRVIAAKLVAGDAVVVRFESGASGTALTGQMTCAASQNVDFQFNPHGWFETAAGSLLNMELGGAVTVDGVLLYVEV